MASGDEDSVVDEADDPRLQREALITEPCLASIPSVLGGSQFPVHIVLSTQAGRGSKILTEQRSWQHFLGLGDHVKRRKKEKKEGVHGDIAEDWGLGAAHVSIPTVHRRDTMKVVCFSFPHILAWLFEIHKKYVLGNGAYGSDAKMRKIEACMCDVFESAKLGSASLTGPPPSVSVGGIRIVFDGDLKINLGAVLDKFTSMPQEWSFIREHGTGLKPRAPWSDWWMHDACDILMFLIGRDEMFLSKRSRVLQSFRNAIATVTGTQRVSK
jgi:hypothetical protein